MSAPDLEKIFKEAEARHAELRRMADQSNLKLLPLTSDLPPVNSVQVFRLKSHGTTDHREGQIPVHPGSELYPNHRSEILVVTGKRMLTGEEALKLADEWRRLEFDVLFSALCHMPAYALKFSATNRVLLQVTVCWRCSNFVNDSGTIGSGFNTGLESARTLRNHLERLLPLEDR